MMSVNQNSKIVAGLNIRQVHIADTGNILMPLPFVAMLLENVLYAFFSCQQPGIQDAKNDVPKQPGCGDPLLTIKVPGEKGGRSSGESSVTKTGCSGLAGLRKIL